MDENNTICEAAEFEPSEKLDKEAQDMGMESIATGEEQAISFPERMTPISSLERCMIQDTVSLYNMIPEEERAIEAKACQEFSKAKQLGFLTSAAGMRRLDDVLDDKAFASISVDKKGTRFIEFCQQYSDGRFSPKTIVPQADLIFASINEFCTDGIKIPYMKSRLNKFMVTVATDYLGKFNGDVIWDMTEVLKALVKAMPQLPVLEDGDDMTPEQFYTQFMENVKHYYAEEHYKWMYRTSYIVFEKTPMEFLAKEMQMQKAELITRLKQYNLLYLTPSSVGNQCKVRIGPEEYVNGYCVLRLEYINKVAESDR